MYFCKNIYQMERTIYQDLLEWKDNTDKKPLILLGARQVGKTYILKEFGNREFDNLIYVNCHKDSFALNLKEHLQKTMCSNI